MLRNFARVVILVVALSSVLASQAEAVSLDYTTGLRLWLRADAGVYNNAGTTLASNGNSVQQWNDQLTGDNIVAQNATQATSGLRPQFVTNVINGLPVVRFNAGSTGVLGDYMDGASVLSGNVARTVFIVGTSLDSSLVNSMLELNRDPAATGGQLYRITPEVGVRISSGNRIFDTAIGTTPQILTISNATGANVSSLVALLDGNPLNQLSVSPNFINTGTGGYRIGAAHDLNPSSDFSGDIAEILVFEGELDEAALNLVGGYLEVKYGLNTAFELPPAPEPSTCLLASLGLCALGLRRRRMKTADHKVA